MAKYRIEVREVVTVYRAKCFEAVNAAAATEQAEAEDWREWEKVYDCGESSIEHVEELAGVNHG